MGMFSDVILIHAVLQKRSLRLSARNVLIVVAKSKENPAQMTVGLYTWIQTISPVNLPSFYVSERTSDN